MADPITREQAAWVVAGDKARAANAAAIAKANAPQPEPAVRRVARWDAGHGAYALTPPYDTPPRDIGRGDHANGRIVATPDREQAIAWGYEIEGGPIRKVARWDGRAADWRLSPPHRLTDPEGSAINASRAQAIAWGYEVDVLDELRELAHLIETQPNAATSDPYYTVQQKRRDYGIEQGYGEDGFVWVVDGEESDPAEWSEENGLPFDPDDPPKGWSQVYYRERWEHVHAFLTREAALAFMAREAHNHGPLRTYVESACRNPEMRRLRALPAQCAAEIAKLREQLAAKGST